MKRSWIQDIHAAVDLSVSSNELELILANHTVYRYYVNGAGQLIRVKLGGGTSVLADGIAHMNVKNRTGVIDISIRFLDGSTEDFRASTLAAMLKQ